MSNNNALETLKLLVAADKLLLQDFIDRLLPFIHEKLEEFMKNDAISILQFVFNYNAYCIPLIRWNIISSAEFWNNRTFFQNVLSKELYQDILAYYLDSTTPPAKTIILKPRIKPSSQDFKKFEEASYVDLANINENELNLKDFIDKIIFFMHQDLEGFMKHDSVDVLKIVFQYDACKSLRNMCLQFICSSPDSLFEHHKFVLLDQSILSLILQRDDLGKLNEIDIWNYLVKWGIAIAKNQLTLQNDDMKTWKDEEYGILKNIIDECIPLIRCSLPKEITILPPRYKLDHMPLIRSEQFNIIASWIDKKDLEKTDQSFLSALFQSSNTSGRKSKLKDTLYYNSNNNPYEFIPLYCSKRGGPEEFHKLCDNKGPTITIAKLRINDSEICLFGGYNNLSWKSYGHKKNQYHTYSKSNRNFLFLFDNENDITTSKISRVKKSCFAAGYCTDTGPIFGSKNYYYYFDSKPTFKKWLAKGNSKSNYTDFKNFVKLQKSSSFTVLDYDVWQ
ncbi:19236_t:CDS:2, partial [Dentiscutata erythropus]